MQGFKIHDNNSIETQIDYYRVQFLWKNSNLNLKPFEDEGVRIQTLGKMGFKPHMNDDFTTLVGQSLFPGSYQHCEKRWGHLMV